MFETDTREYSAAQVTILGTSSILSCNSDKRQPTPLLVDGLQML